MKKILMVASVSLALGACQTNYAQKSIPMSPKMMQFFADWSVRPHAGFFAMSQDARFAGISYCPEYGGCAGANEANALSMCESGSKGVPCVIYGAAGKPVVDDPKLAAYLAANKGDFSFNTSRSMK